MKNVVRIEIAWLPVALILVAWKAVEVAADMLWLFVP